MALQTSGSMSYVLDESITSIALDTFFDETMLWPSLYSQRTSSARREGSATVGSLGKFTPKTPGANADEDVLVQEFQKYFVHQAFGKTVPIDRELYDDARDGKSFDFIQQYGSQLGMSAAYTMEDYAAAVLRDAFAGVTYKAADGLSLCNAAHVNADGGNSQSNTGTSAFTLDAVNTTRIAMRKFKNSRGLLQSVRPNLLIGPPELEQSMWEVVRSTGKPNTANRADNFWNGMFGLYIWDFLSTGVDGGDVNNWFMADSRLMAQSLLWYWRVGLEVYGDGNLFSGTRRVGAYYRASHGVVDWRFIFGHAVT
ncbi:MAG TPA: hypothetical protein VJ787_06755 [Thermoleophilia bacterium]|nr:hypothetical protein [Thermoleophilia bacterium]